MKKTIQMIILILILSGIAMADCVYNGQTYPEEATHGSYIALMRIGSDDNTFKVTG